MYVQSTMGFGATEDGTQKARLLVNGEIIEAVSRTQTPGDFRFMALTRGLEATTAKAHPVGTLVYDISANTSARDLLYRGFFLRTAVSEDLDTNARNLGVPKCAGLDQETWRRVIRAMAYLPKQPLDAFRVVLKAYFNNETSWEVYELPSKPYTTYVDVDVAAATDVRGRFFLNGGLRRLTTGLTTVTTPYPIGSVSRVVVENSLTKRGHRNGQTNYFASFVGSTITLGSSPGPIGTAVLIDWRPTNNRYHYLANDTNDKDTSDRYPYFSDSLAPLRCLLDHVRAAGTRVELRVRS
jgi:hypothetical protein